MKLAGFGLAIDLEPGWEGRLFRRTLRHGEEVTHPVVHLANIPLPEVRADFGGGVVEHLRSGDCFAVLFDYGAQAASQPLFAHRGVPELRSSHFTTARLQRTLPGQVGAQMFFQSGGRAMCLYVVLGSASDKSPVGVLNAMLGRAEVTPW